MRIIIAGGTGFIGRVLATRLLEKGYEVVVLSRDPERMKIAEGIQMVRWDGVSSRGWRDLTQGSAAIINLVGKNISESYWSNEVKREIVESRINAGKAIVEALKFSKAKIGVVIQASATGYYGSRGEEELDETSPRGRGYLSEVAQNWELSTEGVETLGTRRVVLRTAVVLGKSGGALPRLMRPFRYYLGGTLGSGNQWFSWIHMADEVEAICFLMEHQELSGAFNLSAPQPARMKDLAREIGRLLNKPSGFKFPVLLLKTVLGAEITDEVLMASQRVIPRRLLEAGFTFRFIDAASALRDLLGDGI